MYEREGCRQVFFVTNVVTGGAKSFVKPLVKCMPISNLKQRI
jgi:hypothetical protein